MDLAAATGFDRETALANVRRVAPQARILELSARSGAGLDEWYGLLAASRPARGPRGAAAPAAS
jgi:hydrogenase nickel incorporation protein HypB